MSRSFGSSVKRTEPVASLRRRRKGARSISMLSADVEKDHPSALSSVFQSVAAGASSTSNRDGLLAPTPKWIRTMLGATGRISIGTPLPRSSFAASTTALPCGRMLRTFAIDRGSRGRKSLAGRAGLAATSRAGSTLPGGAAPGRWWWACHDQGAPGFHPGG